MNEKLNFTNEKALHITIIEGTDRPGRQSIKAAKLITTIGEGIDGIEVLLVDPVNFNFSYEHGDPRFTDIVKNTDAFIIVTPEYNHSFPGTLKALLDTELKGYIHKPVMLAGVSSGRFGGVRAVESLVPVVRELGLVVTFTDLYFPQVKDFFDENDKPKDLGVYERIREAYAELVWMGRTLKWGRENLASKYHS